MKRMKKAISLCLTLLFLLALLPGAALAETSEDWEYAISDSSATITKYTGGGGSVEIPSALGGYPVTSIGDYAFFDCDSLTGVTIPEGVTSIGDSAFASCDSLTNVFVDLDNPSFCSVDGVLFNKDRTVLVQYPGGRTGDYSIPEGVTSIGNYAFENCDSLTGVTIPASVTSIGDDAFWSCVSLTGVTIPASVTSIGNSAFAYCDSLTGVTIPEGVTSIGYAAFSNCVSLTGVTIPASVTSIGDYAFWNCDSLTGVTIPASVTSIGDSAFEYCHSLTGVTIPASVTSIGDSAFAYCDSLTGVTIPEGVTSIGDSAFRNCASLTGVTIPEGVTSIGDYAFYGCYSLTGVTIPSSVTSIMYVAFAYCDSLTDVYFRGSEAQWQAIQIEGYNDPLLNANIHYNSASLPTAYRYVPYSAGLSASTGSTFTLLSGSLPAGLSLSADGTVSGMATELGSFSFKVRESDGTNSTEYTVTMFVYAQAGTDVEAFNEPGYGFVETAADDGRVQDQTVSSREELTDQVMHCEAAYSSFADLYIDAKKLVRGKDYTAEEGSTRITITAETIGEVGGGTHTIAAEFRNEIGESVYTVQNYSVAGIASKEVHVRVKGTLIVWTDSEPYIDTNSRTMTPFRAVGEALGLSVAWDSSTREASFTDGAKTIYFPIGSTTARTSDGGTVTMDTSAVIVNGRTYAPIRYLAEFFGCSVGWDGVSRTVIIE